MIIWSCPTINKVKNMFIGYSTSREFLLTFWPSSSVFYPRLGYFLIIEPLFNILNSMLTHTALNSYSSILNYYSYSYRNLSLTVITHYSQHHLMLNPECKPTKTVRTKWYHTILDSCWCIYVAAHKHSTVTSPSTFHPSLTAWPEACAQHMGLQQQQCLHCRV